MTKKIILSALLICVATICSFGQTASNYEDEHGCSISAGYIYSTLKKDCIRIFEQSIRVDNAFLKESAIYETCILFSEDNKMAEIFITNSRDLKGIILNRFGKKGNYIWKNDVYVVGRNTNGYYITKSGVLIYKN